MVFDMAHLSEFSDRDWDLAPSYKSGATMPGVIGLDFGELKEIAIDQEDKRAFRKTPDGTFGKAPIYVDGLPAAMYLLETKAADQFTPNHSTADNEMMVVVDGMLRFVFNNGEDRPEPSNLQATYYPGQVLQFRNAEVSMQAVNVFDPARALAIALFRDDNPKIQFEML
jgi:hypothetical protein